MKVNLIIGAGQLGSRHLQGMLSTNVNQTIYVLDPSQNSLEVAKQRSTEISHDSELHFVTSLSDVPKTIDVAIVATNANVRAAVTQELLNKHIVKFLILEKILFQDLVSYETIGDLILQTKTQTWVNHSRRLLDHYVEIAQELKDSAEIVSFHAFGGNWGLACNGLHYVDLATYLSNSTVKSIEMSEVDSVIHKSKRENYIEFTGTFSGIMQNGARFSVTSLAGDLIDVTVTISTLSNRWVILEGGKKAIRVLRDGKFSGEISEINSDFQSKITADVLRALYENETCSLPTFLEAKSSHIPFISSALDKYNSITNLNVNSCPIT